MMVTYAVFVNTVTHVPGDQRSRDCPGHGYPAYDESRTEVVEFKSKDEFIAWVEREEKRAYGKQSYRAFECTPIQVSTKVVIDIK